MEFRAFVAKAPHLTIPRQSTLVYGGKLLFSNAAAKLPKAISQKRHDGFSFLNDGNLDKCLSKKKIRLATPALWLSSPHWAKCMTKSKFLETACKNYCTHTSAPRHVRVPRSRNFSDCCLVGRKRTRGPEDDTLCMGFDQDAIIFFLLSFCFFSLWSRKLHLMYAHRYFLDIYDTLEQSKELSRRGFWLDDRCLKMTIGFTLLLYSFTFAEEVLGASSSAKDPELTWIFASAIPGRKEKRW